MNYLNRKMFCNSKFNSGKGFFFSTVPAKWMKFNLVRINILFKLINVLSFDFHSSNNLLQKIRRYPNSSMNIIFLRLQIFVISFLTLQKNQKHVYNMFSMVIDLYNVRWNYYCDFCLTIVPCPDLRVHTLPLQTICLRFFRIG